MPTTPINLKRNTGLPSLGIHLFKVTRVGEKDGSETNSGFATWYMTCTCQDGTDDDKGKEVLHSLSHSPKARFKIDEFLDAVGAPEKGSAGAEAFVGKLFRANVTHGSYQNRPTAYLESLMPAEGSFPSDVNLDEAIADVEDAFEEEEADLSELQFSSDDEMPF